MNTEKLEQVLEQIKKFVDAVDLACSVLTELANYIVTVVRIAALKLLIYYTGGYIYEWPKRCTKYARDRGRTL